MSNETTELLPCPFCGCKASVKVLEYDDDCKVWGVFCESDLQSEYSHGHFVDNYPTEAEAIAAWNARHHCGLTDEDYNILLDELGVSERTCRMEYQTEGMQRGWWKCSECGEAMDTIEACGGRKPPRWCGNCGAKVVSE